MKRHVTKNFVKAMFACFMLTLSMVTIPVCATAKPDAGSVAPYRLVTADVLDTYKSFSTANHPSENVDCFDQTYKRLSFKTSLFSYGANDSLYGCSVKPTRQRDARV